jgi:arylsulfatase A-like enzyme
VTSRLSGASDLRDSRVSERHQSADLYPSKASHATGRYPQRTEVGLYEPLTARDRDEGLPPGHPTIASLVKAARYETALIGRWHLGWKLEFGQNRHGFDEFFGILSGACDYFTHPLEWPGTGGPGILE